MSVNVLVIPEDFRKDQYVLKPIVEQMMQALGIRAKVRICTDPLLGGVDEALKWDRLAEIIERYRGMIRIFLLVVDRDCNLARADRLRALEQQAANMLAGTSKAFLGENAWLEIEVWALAGMLDLPVEWRWKDVREERHPKERYYDGYARAVGCSPVRTKAAKSSPGKQRATTSASASSAPRMSQRSRIASARRCADRPSWLAAWRWRIRPARRRRVGVAASLRRRCGVVAASLPQASMVGVGVAGRAAAWARVPRRSASTTLSASSSSHPMRTRAEWASPSASSCSPISARPTPWRRR